MSIRFFAGALCLLTLALPAAAQWQPLDGGANGSLGTPSTASPPASGNGIQGWTSTPAYGGTTTPTPANPPPTGGTPPANPPAVGGPGPATPPPAPQPTITLTYGGRAAADPRTADMRLVLTGRAVTGHVTMHSLTAPNVRLCGADIDLRGGVNGAWESATGSIEGTWAGIDHNCGNDTANHGQFRFFLKDLGMGHKVLHLQVSGQNGTYGWNFTPSGKVYVGAVTAPAKARTFR